METEQIKAQRWQRINDLFHSALEREPDERVPFLARACAGDEGLRREVEALLQAHERSDPLFDAPALELAAGLFAQQVMPSLEGRRLGHYQVLSLIGTGGMGQIFLADDTRLKRQVAIKVLPAAFTVDPDRIRRFEQEALAASSLNHPNILTIHEVGEVEDAPFIVTEFIEGKTLRRQMAAEKMRPPEALDVAIQVASALEAAHKAGIVHRDIKPENIMLRPDGLVKVLDFGLAKLTEAHSSAPDASASTPARLQTKTGLVMGTVTYMSPEQARGLTVDVRTDIFSLGTVIYEMIAGQVPFDGPTNSDVIVSILEREPAPLSRHEPGVPAELERIVMKALAKDSEERYQLAKNLLNDLRNLKHEMDLQAKLHAVKPADSQDATPAAAGLSVDIDDRLRRRSADAEVAHTISSAEYLAGKIKTHKRGVALGVAALVIAVAAIVYFTYFTGKPDTENAEALYQQGIYYWRKNTEEATLKSGEYFQLAIEKDPNFALAYVGLAQYYAMMAGFGQLRPNEAWPKAEEAVIKALALDDGLADAHGFLGMVKIWYDWDWRGAERELKRAIELNHPEGEARGMYNRLLEMTGRIDEAIADASVEWNEPRGSRLQREERLARLFSLAGRYNEAIEAWRKVLEKESNRRGIAHLNI